jgi:hypothetical protein
MSGKLSKEIVDFAFTPTCPMKVNQSGQCIHSQSLGTFLIAVGAILKARRGTVRQQT